MFSNAKVREKVCSYTYGWGEIHSIHSITDTEFPIIVKFPTGRFECFTFDGKFDKLAINQDLFYDEIKVEIPESAKKPKVECEHNWIEINNDHVKDIFICSKCHSLIAASDLNKPKVEWKFPCYGECNKGGIKYSGLIVYFERHGYGTVLQATVAFPKFYNGKWDMEDFTPCTLETKDIK